jgi:FkbM family methyltransferase
MLAHSVLWNWGRFSVAPGYRYQLIERLGGYLDRGPLKTRLFNGCDVVCRLGDHIQRQIYFFGAYEPIESFLFQRLLAPGMCVIDAGANIGQYTLVASNAVGASGQIHAFEPVAGNVKQLAHHVAINGFADRVRINECSLWNCDETLTLHLDAGDEHENMTNYSVNDQGTSVRSFRSPSLRLDDYARRRGLDRLDVIKMDIEGAELKALEGAGELLRSFRPTILLEINRAHATGLGSTPEAISDLLVPLGYRIRTIGESPETCRAIESLRDVVRANVLLWARALPTGFWEGWTYKQILSEFRKGQLGRAPGY